MDRELVRADQRGPVLLLTFNRPERLNAWTDELEDVYFDLLDAAEIDPSVRAVVVTGAGRGFCAGADMDLLAAAPHVGAEQVARPRPRHRPLAFRKPLIAAINGPASGLGLVEALYCDVRLASESATFLTSFVGRGLVAEYGSSWLLPRLVGFGRVSDLLLSGRRVGADEALRIGLVERVVADDELIDAALGYAGELAVWSSPTSIATIKGQLLRDGSRGFDDAVADAGALMLESFAGPDLTEGIASFTDRRAPIFAPLNHLEK